MAVPHTHTHIHSVYCVLMAGQKDTYTHTHTMCTHSRALTPKGYTHTHTHTHTQQGIPTHTQDSKEQRLKTETARCDQVEIVTQVSHGLHRLLASPCAHVWVHSSDFQFCCSPPAQILVLITDKQFQEFVTRKGLPDTI